MILFRNIKYYELNNKSEKRSSRSLLLLLLFDLLSRFQKSIDFEIWNFWQTRKITILSIFYIFENMKYQKL